MNAHLRGEYALSVPIFFAQADGISAAMVGRHIFSGKKGRSDHISSLAAEKISDLESHELAKNIAKKIEAELKYPGEIKVNLLRELRVIEYAR